LDSKLIGGKGAIYSHLDRKVTIGHRGLIRLEIEILGQAVHTGIMEWCCGLRGVNAVTALSEVLCMIEKENWPEGLHEAFPALRLTVTPGTVISGGTFESVVPAYAKAMVDIRTMPNQESSGILARIEEIASKVVESRNARLKPENGARLAFKIIVKNNLPSAFIPLDHPLAVACRESVQQITGLIPDVRGCGPANEGYMLIHSNIPTICGFGVVGGHPHAIDEWISVESLIETVEIYQRVLEKYCKL